MTIKLTDAELAMLSQAVNRDDKCLSRPATLNGARLIKFQEKLIEAGLVRQIKAKASSQIWRRDEEGDASFALKLTASGIKLVKELDAVATPALAHPEPTKQRKPKTGSLDVDRSRTAESPPADVAVPSALPQAQRLRETPRVGSKIAKVIELLRSDNGATICELIAATGWLPHTTRAALTGLRKRGHTVALVRSQGGRGSIYRIKTEPSALEPVYGNVVAEAP